VLKLFEQFLIYRRDKIFDKKNNILLAFDDSEDNSTHDMNLRDIYVKKKFVLIMIFLLVYFNYMNILRIKEEFIRNDEYKFVNFPFFPASDKQYLVRYTSANNRYFSPVNKQHQDHCFNLPTICSSSNIDLLFYDIFYRKIIFITFF
jgi:hypothetical protein